MEIDLCLSILFRRCSCLSLQWSNDFSFFVQLLLLRPNQLKLLLHPTKQSLKHQQSLLPLQHLCSPRCHQCPHPHNLLQANQVRPCNKTPHGKLLRKGLLWLVLRMRVLNVKEGVVSVQGRWPLQSRKIICCFIHLVI